jgi:hypothetical protein
MNLRLIDTRSAGSVIPLWTNETSTKLTSHEDDPIPEPAQLYGLTVLAFLLHKPMPFMPVCVRCRTVWPCDHLRLAYRLREGF